MSDKSKAYQSMEDAFHAEAAARIAAESELFALGIQHEALKARLKLAEAVFKAADFVINDSRVKVDGVNAYLAMRAAYDAVPGDVGQP